MGNKTGIAWTDATWNPTTGCTRVSAGCDRCYAFQLHDQRHVAWKRGNMPNAAPQYHKPFSQVQLLPERLSLPLHWKRPRRVFVDSMSDLFHDDVPTDFVFAVLDTCVRAQQHTFQVLTKRPARMQSVVNAYLRRVDAQTPIPNLWLGVSVEDQQRADERIPVLAETPAAVRFLSCEPLLGPLDLTPWLWENVDRLDRRRDPELHPEEWEPRGALHWLIAGGESGGPDQRALVERCNNCGNGAPAATCPYCCGSPWQPTPDGKAWVRALRDQCAAAGVPFFFKQWGGALPTSGGRELDGQTWDEFPRLAVPA